MKLLALALLAALATSALADDYNYPWYDYKPGVIAPEAVYAANVAVKVLAYNPGLLYKILGPYYKDGYYPTYVKTGKAKYYYDAYGNYYHYVEAGYTYNKVYYQHPFIVVKYKGQQYPTHVVKVSYYGKDYYGPYSLAYDYDYTPYNNDDGYGTYNLVQYYFKTLEKYPAMLKTMYGDSYTPSSSYDYSNYKANVYYYKSNDDSYYYATLSHYYGGKEFKHKVYYYHNVDKKTLYFPAIYYGDNYEYKYDSYPLYYSY